MINQAGFALDIRLLRILNLLLTERSVSKTAAVLGLTQPAVSFALRRIREIFHDPLLVRSGARLVLTERGEELSTRIAGVLSELDEMIEPKQGFDPRSSARRVTILAPNCMGTFVFPRIVTLLNEEAPGMSVNLCPMPTPDGFTAALESGEIDLVIGNWPKPPENLKFMSLFETPIACMVRGEHPLSRKKRLTMQEYLAADHLSPSPPNQTTCSPITRKLESLSLTRRVKVSVPEYTIVPYLLAQSDLVFTTGRPFADHLASIMPFAVIDAPPELGVMQFYLLWHERSHRSPVNRWLRNLVRRAMLDIAIGRTKQPITVAPRGHSIHKVR